MTCNWRLAAAASIGLWGAAAAAQPGGDLAAVMQRLERLEQENRSLREELRQIKDSLGLPPMANTPTVPERLEVQERRIEEQAQSKVEAAQKFPLRLSGMVLFNTFLNSGAHGGTDFPTIAASGALPKSGGGTLRQSMVNLEFDGPKTVFRANVHGSLSLDFFAGSGQPLDQQMRVRTGLIHLQWKNSTLTAGQDKSIMFAHEPFTIARVGVQGLVNAGNLWAWQPQARFEQRVPLGLNSGIRARIGVFQTEEIANAVTAADADASRGRPALQGRFEYWRQWGETVRIEIAPGFHRSQSHANLSSIPSRLFSIDFRVRPAYRVDLTGALFSGHNVANLGVAGIGQGFVFQRRNLTPVHSKGGWSQLSLLMTERLKLNLLAGTHDDRDRDLTFRGIGRNSSYGGNLIYQIAPNVLGGFEFMQVRTRRLGLADRILNRYDLSLGYLF